MKINKFIKSLPNIITAFRVICAPILAIVIIKNIYGDSIINKIIFATIYASIAFTDKIDGWIAKKFNAGTKAGKCMDPISDKIFVSVLLIALTYHHKCWFTNATLIIIREFAVSGLREYTASQKQISINSSMLSKIKTVIQMIAIGLIAISKQDTIYLEISNFILFISVVIGFHTMHQYIQFAKKNNLF